MKNFTFLICLFCVSIKLFSQAGNLDSSFGINGLSESRGSGNGDDRFNDMALQSDGKIIAAGTLNSNDAALARYTANGSLDGSFGVNGFANTSIIGKDYNFSIALAVAVQQNDKIIVAVNADGNNAMNSFLIRYNEDGTPDNSFGNNAIVTVNSTNDIRDIQLQPDGKIIVCGNNGYLSSILARYNNNGTPDNAFGDNGGVTIKLASHYYTTLYKLSLKSTGKIVVVGSGQFGQQVDGSNIFLACYNSNGSIDSSFGTNGITVIGTKASVEYAVGLSIPANDKILVGGNSFNDEPYTNGIGVIKYNADGSLDNSFGNKGFAKRFVTSFSPNVNDITVQQDGKIIIAGVFINSTILSVTVARLNPNGAPDKSFGNNGVTALNTPGKFTEANAVLLQSDGKILTAGSIESSRSSKPQSFLIARFLPGENNLDGNKKANIIAGKNIQPVIYPNPVKNYLHVSGLPKEKVKLTIVDFYGNEKASITVSANEYNWDVAQLKSGNYLLIAKAEGVNPVSKQFVKE